MQNKGAPVGAPLIFTSCTLDSAIKFKSLMRLSFVWLAHLPYVTNITSVQHLYIQLLRYTSKNGQYLALVIEMSICPVG